MSLLLCFEDTKHHAVVIIMIKSNQLENISKEQELVPSFWRGRAPFAVCFAFHFPSF